MTYQWPFCGKYSLGTAYGVKGKMWSCGWHSGQDFFSKAKGGDGNIYPVAPGTVVRVTTTGSYGNCVYVNHADGYISLYAHMSKVLVKAGQSVTNNTVLGVEGTTGNSTAVHLHLEIHKGSYSYPSKIDPKKFIEDKIKEATPVPTPKIPSSWAKEAWEKAIKAGITDGTDPQGMLTREQLMVILDRLKLIP